MSSGSSLIDAARRGDADAVRAHLREATQCDSRGWTALMHASARNFAECVKALIPYERGLADPQKITALMIAADNGHTEVVRLLAKEESRLQNSDGWTALMHASYRGFDECAELLLDEAGMQTTRRKDGMAPGSTALMVAARFSRPECVELLRDREKGVVDSEGHDALWYAENKGVNPNVKTSEVYRDPRVMRLLGKRPDAISRAEKGSSLTSTRANIHQPIPTSQHSIGAGNRSPCSLTESDGMQRTTLSPSAPLVAANLATASPSKKLDGTQNIPSAEKGRLEKTISNLQRELQRMQEELASRDKEIQGLRAVNRQRSTNSIDGDVLTSQRIVSLAIPDSRTKMLQETLNQKNQEIDQLNAEIIGLRGDVKDREEEIRDLQAQLEKSLNLRAQLEASQNTNKKKQRELDDYIAALRLENEELRREYNRMETKNVREAEASRNKGRKEIKQLNAVIASMRAGIGEKSKRIRELEEVLKENERHRSQESGLNIGMSNNIAPDSNISQVMNSKECADLNEVKGGLIASEAPATSGYMSYTGKPDPGIERLASQASKYFFCDRLQKVMRLFVSLITMFFN
ncbi:Ankyrin repeat protein 1 [Giardia muris]|uniref:Ankyrin repeat protein 1 n=1 Tax=Giardia muris TaxID=5742 RepID=A0A4Z1T6S7_GIAMU|nr:Ankyrin repeat protein 1 [Giardia muris]|eukprot:TNJ28191.1 Ankyrin repeat protein 1 [Giardia muris]